MLLQAGPGVKDLVEGDVVLPTTPLLGTFTEAAVVKAKQLVRVGKLASLDSNSAPHARSQGDCTGWGCVSRVGMKACLLCSMCSLQRDAAICLRWSVGGIRAGVQTPSVTDSPVATPSTRQQHSSFSHSPQIPCEGTR